MLTPPQQSFTCLQGTSAGLQEQLKPIRCVEIDQFRPLIHEPVVDTVESCAHCGARSAVREIKESCDNLPEKMDV